MAGWRRNELKVGVYDEIVSVRLDRQLTPLGAPFEVYCVFRPIVNADSGRS